MHSQKSNTFNHPDVHTCIHWALSCIEVMRRTSFMESLYWVQFGLEGASQIGTIGPRSKILWRCKRAVASKGHTSSSDVCKMDLFYKKRQAACLNIIAVLFWANITYMQLIHTDTPWKDRWLITSKFLTLSDEANAHLGGHQIKIIS